MNHVLSVYLPSLCRHYAAKLDGCGLDLENQVRKSYRLLLSRLLEAIKTVPTPSSQYVEYCSHSNLSIALALIFICAYQWTKRQ